jgi:hypothetical protein
MYKIKETAKLNISKNLERKIDYLHSRLPGLEWSGALLVKITGKLTDIKNLKVIAEDFLLCDVGEAAFTTFKLSEHLDLIQDTFPQIDPLGSNLNLWDGVKNTNGYKLALIHTHHNMNVYFSQTDLKELEENTDIHGFYVSLIVGTNKKYVAKGSIKSETEIIKNVKSSYLNTSFKTVEKEKCIITFDFSVENPHRAVDLVLDARIAELEAANIKKTANKNYSYRQPQFNHNFPAKTYSQNPSLKPGKIRNKAERHINKNLDPAHFEVFEDDFMGTVYRSKFSPNSYYDQSGASLTVEERNFFLERQNDKQFSHHGK